MASESWSSGTTTVAYCVSSSMSTSETLAGDSALATNTDGSSLHWMTSMRSPRSSPTTMRMRLPLGPTQAPTGSRLDSRLATAILERAPASRAIDFTSTTPS